MSRVVDLQKQIDEYQAAEHTASALEDISALREQAVRRQYDKNRSFFEEIRALYAVVQSHAEKKDLKKNLEEKQEPKNLKLLYVAITSNKRFYGALIRDIVETAVALLGEVPQASCFIVGRVGWQYFEIMGNTKRARRIVWEDDVPTQAEIQDLLGHFEGFNRIFVLHPKFVNSFTQDVGMLDITQTPDTSDAPQGKTGYIFEPEVPALLSFFDTQVRRVLLDRVLLEAELSRTAARLMRMEEASERARTILTSAGAHLRHEKAAVSNAQLLETFSGFAQWSHQ